MKMMVRAQKELVIVVEPETLPKVVKKMNTVGMAESSEYRALKARAWFVSIYGYSVCSRKI